MPAHTLPPFTHSTAICRSFVQVFPFFLAPPGLGGCWTQVPAQLYRSRGGGTNFRTTAARSSCLAMDSCWERENECGYSAMYRIWKQKTFAATKNPRDPLGRNSLGVAAAAVTTVTTAAAPTRARAAAEKNFF